MFVSVCVVGVICRVGVCGMCLCAVLVGGTGSLCLYCTCVSCEVQQAVSWELSFWLVYVLKAPAALSGRIIIVQGDEGFCVGRALSK